MAVFSLVVGRERVWAPRRGEGRPAGFGGGCPPLRGAQTREEVVLRGWQDRELTGTYDAGGRLTEVEYPEGMKVRNTYNQAGALDEIEVDRGAGGGWQTVVEEFTYDARGKATGWTHGNGVVTTREYDSDIERLTRIYTKLPGSPDVEYQDLNYSYDPVGNPLEIEDALSSSSVAHNQIIPNTRTFSYDPRYRLVNATGKKHTSVGYKSINPYVPSPDINDYSAYDIDYEYDEVGNLTKNQEYAAGTLSYKSSRIDLFNGDSTEATNSDPTLGNYRYDANGNTLHTPRHEELAYTHDNQVRYVDMDGGGEVRYFQHGDQRVVRMLRKTGVDALGIYLGPFEYHQRAGTTSYTKLVLHIQAVGRHAQVERMLSGSDSNSMDIFYQHSDHLGSGHSLTKSDGDLLSQEEFFPYGRASDRRDTRNRYRFIGVERDEDTNLCITGPRLYDPVLGRFYQGDLILYLFGSRAMLNDKGDQYRRLTPFHYSLNRPMLLVDSSGWEPYQKGATNVDDFVSQLQQVGINSIQELSNIYNVPPARRTQEENEFVLNYRFIYSPKVGWLDIRHFSYFATLEETGSKVSRESAMFQGYVAEVRQGLDGYVLSLSWPFALSMDSEGKRGSCFAYEDLQSNLMGMTYGQGAASGLTESDFYKSIQSFFTDYLGSTDPTQAPNWDTMRVSRTDPIDGEKQFIFHHPEFAPDWDSFVYYDPYKNSAVLQGPGWTYPHNDDVQ